MQYTSLSALCINTLLTKLFQSGKVTLSQQQTVACLLRVFQKRKSTNQEVMFYQELKSQRPTMDSVSNFNPLNAELNPICHLLALLGAHHILHVSRIRVKACFSANMPRVLKSESICAFLHSVSVCAT
jgi:hypothetical protein